MVDTAPMTAADTMTGYIQALPDGATFGRATCAADRASRKTATRGLFVDIDPERLAASPADRLKYNTKCDT